MNENEIIITEEFTNTEKTAEQVVPMEEIVEKKHTSRKNWLYESLDLSRWFHYETVIRNLPFILFLSGIGIFYIANAHYAEKNVRELNHIEKLMNEMRWEYMTTKSELEYLSKQSEVAQMLEAEGIQELQEPPQKIVVTQNEH